MSDDVAIHVDHVSKEFKLPHEKQTSIKGALINLTKTGKRNRSFERQQVLNDVSFDIKKGEFFGIVGRNGSGKSTLLKMLAGIYVPTKGGITVDGKLTPFIELGVGFNPELTGRENVFLNGALLGFNRAEMLALYDDIVAFAEIEKFMDQKLKNYSSGMQVRLAFSIAIRAESEILLLDEVLAVGDAIFQQKCFDYFKRLKKEKKTVILVSHDATTLQTYCDRGVLIESGDLIYQGPIREVVNRYQDTLVAKERELSKEVAATTQKSRGSQDVQITAVTLSGSQQSKQSIYSDADEIIDIKVEYKANVDGDKPVFGVIISDASGQQVFASNTLWSKIEVPTMIRAQHYSVTWTIPNIFNTGSYTVSPAVANGTANIIYDWQDDIANFKVRKKLTSTALTNVPHVITVGLSDEAKVS